MFPKRALTYFTLTLLAGAAGLVASTGVLQAAQHEGHEHAASDIEKAVVVLTSTAGNKATGTITFTAQEDGVLIEGTIEGLTADTEHGFHIHEFGDLTSEDGSAMGGHFNPSGDPHGAPDAEERHAGDFGNLEADASGKATYSRVDKHISIDSILGRGMVVHAKADDLKSQPSGDAGARIAQGVIGVAQVKK